jgi:hypothetical protein
MPSWLWRAWLGPPAARGPRGLLGRRPRRRLRPPPPPGRPEPCPPPCPDAPCPPEPCPPEPCPDPPPCPCPDPADPLPVPAFIVLSKPAGPGFSRCRRQTSILSDSPLVAAGSDNVGAQPLSSGDTPLTKFFFPPNQAHGCVPGTWIISMTGLRVGLDAIVNATMSVLLGVLMGIDMTHRSRLMQTRTSEKI